MIAAVIWVWIGIAAGVWAAIVLGAWLASCAASRGPMHDDPGNLLWMMGRAYARLVHRVETVGAEHAAGLPGDRPIVVAANHTAGIDPILVQTRFPLFIRWMMAADMQLEHGRWFWEWMRVIPVQRDGSPNARSAIEAVRHLRRGGRSLAEPARGDDAGPGVLGIFPEGGIERPMRHLIPFMPGVGTLVAKSGAIVVPVVIEGTPDAPTAWGSLWRRSRSRVRFLEPVDYAALGTPAGEIAADLQRRFEEATGWPVNGRPDRRLTQR